ncbi:MAG: C4-dicarboxylate ABC transporter substrate-binding protein, partial [Paracoccaceae bacterium]
MSFVKTVATAVAAAAIAATGVLADGHATTNLRVQTHYTPENNSGKLIQKFIDNVQTMSNGEINIEMFWSSSVVKSVEGFDAAATGILDCEMHGGGYQTGKNPAFQFVGDIMGGYDTPYQQLSWLYYAGGLEAAQELYNLYGMQLVGWWVYGQESFASTRPIASTEDLKGWKFRSP